MKVVPSISTSECSTITNTVVRIDLCYPEIYEILNGLIEKTIQKNHKEGK